ncbi:MAG: enoyl-CoA hydratase-related protein [Acidobacteria bacterium]|nr:enoyl-CoA hydratase-related protein [Acidobacteriota bacterium]MCI0624477.1 enoyl-CoA hydratase-related protein [Acidobacteriota bacterium]MCI0718972.1 enoyl-CoA hydratase-related protein [Acidobacteriota bacterium]
MSYQNLLVMREDPVAIVQLNRPKVLNALNLALMQELVDALQHLDQDEKIRCLILTGDEKAFAAGADIREMADAGPIEMLQRNTIPLWDRVQAVSKPTIAAVSGYALGGGCELALLCDIIVASETARFAQPEINIGVIPGAGGTQRLARTLGKHKAMEFILTGRTMLAQEALDAGLACRVVPPEACLDEARKLAVEICQRSPLAVKLAKEAILKAFEGSLREGLDFERKCFYLMFGSEDQKEGMRAFLEKRQAEFKGR